MHCWKCYQSVAWKGTLMGSSNTCFKRADRSGTRWDVVNFLCGYKVIWHVTRHRAAGSCGPGQIRHSEDSNERSNWFFENVTMSHLIWNRKSSYLDNAKYFTLFIRRQAIIVTNAEIFTIQPLETNFSEIVIKIQKFSSTKMHLNISSGYGCHFVQGEMS